MGGKAPGRYRKAEEIEECGERDVLCRHAVSGYYPSRYQCLKLNVTRSSH